MTNVRWSVVVLLFWVWLYRQPDRHPFISATELAYIRQDPPEPPGAVPWASLVRRRQTWAFMLGMMASSPVWWFYIFWVPDFLNKRFGLGLTQSSLPLVVIFFAASIGGIGGMAGSMAGMVFAQIVARVLAATNNNYAVPFAIAATTYSAALLLIHLLLPRLEPMTLEA